MEELEFREFEGHFRTCKFCDGHVFWIATSNEDERDLLIVCSGCNRKTSIRMDG